MISIYGYWLSCARAQTQNVNTRVCTHRENNTNTHGTTPCVTTRMTFTLQDDLLRSFFLNFLFFYYFGLATRIQRGRVKRERKIQNETGWYNRRLCDLPSCTHKTPSTDRTLWFSSINGHFIDKYSNSVNNHHHIHIILLYYDFFFWMKLNRKLSCIGRTCAYVRVWKKISTKYMTSMSTTTTINSNNQLLFINALIEWNKMNLFVRPINRSLS